MTYPCEPTPFQTMFGDVQMCAKCGHGPAPKECREPRTNRMGANGMDDNGPYGRGMGANGGDDNGMHDILFGGRNR